MTEAERLQSYITELRRGSWMLVVLGALQTPFYGYSLLQILQEQGIDMEANTLYPLMRRLESQGLLTSKWDTTETRPRKFYVISEEGKDVLQILLEEWHKLQNQIIAIVRPISSS
jgi:DNA-binding PadR family transcriptional regulator